MEETSSQLTPLVILDEVAAILRRARKDHGGRPAWLTAYGPSGFVVGSSWGLCPGAGHFRRAECMLLRNKEDCHGVKDDSTAGGCRTL